MEPAFLDVGPQLPAQLWAVIDELGGREKMEEHWSIATWGTLVEVGSDNMVAQVDTNVGAKAVKEGGDREPVVERVEGETCVSSGGKGQMDGGV